MKMSGKLKKRSVCSGTRSTSTYIRTPLSSLLAPYTTEIFVPSFIFPFFSLLFQLWWMEKRAAALQSRNLSGRNEFLKISVFEHTDSSKYTESSPEMMVMMGANYIHNIFHFNNVWLFHYCWCGSKWHHNRQVYYSAFWD